MTFSPSKALKIAADLKKNPVLPVNFGCIVFIMNIIVLCVFVYLLVCLYS